MTDTRMQELSAADCMDLLGQHHLGRLAFIDRVGVLPLILPINYVLEQGTVLVRTDAGSTLTAAVLGAPVAFEVDGVDEQHRTGWSVVVRGHASEITDEAELTRARQTPLVSWAPGTTSHYVRISSRQVSGRRISLAALPSQWWG